MPSYILDELECSELDLKGKKVLDAACGIGRWSYGFDRLGCEVFGFDTSPSAVNAARTAVPRGHFERANLLDHDSLSSLYPQKFFDVVWCWGALHHTGDPGTALRNLTPFLKDSGVLHVYVYGKRALRTHVLRFIFNRVSFDHRVSLAKLIARKMPLQTVDGIFDAFSPPIASEHSVREVSAWFSECGLKSWPVHPKWAKSSTDIFLSGRFM